MNTQRAKQAIVSVSALIVLTLGFYDNTFKVAENIWFEHFADGREASIIGRLSRSRQNDIFSEGGLSGAEAKLPEGKHEFKYQYEIYYNAIPIQQYKPYKSHPAIQGIIFSILDRCFGLDAQTNVKFFRFITAVISAAIFGVFLLWVLDIFGLFSALMTLFLIMLSPWITVAGGHIFWMFGIIYLPFLVPLILLHREYKGAKLSLPVWFMSIALSMLLKCLFTGFELITTTLVMMTIPIFFYAIWKHWKPRLFIRRFLTASFAGMLGVIICAVILSIQIAQVDGSMQKGWQHMQQRFLLRTYPNEAYMHKEIPQKIQNANNVAMTTVLKTYLGDRALSITTRHGYVSLSFGNLLLLFAAISVLILIRSKNAPLLALTITTWISILAPLSMFIIFKSLSVRHPHLVYLVWYMPMLLLMFTSIVSLKKSAR